MSNTKLSYLKATSRELGIARPTISETRKEELAQNPEAHAIARALAPQIRRTFSERITARQSFVASVEEDFEALYNLSCEKNNSKFVFYVPARSSHLHSFGGYKDAKFAKGVLTFTETIGNAAEFRQRHISYTAK